MFDKVVPKKIAYTKGIEILAKLDSIKKQIRTVHKRRLSDLLIDNVFADATTNISELHNELKPYYLTDDRKKQMLFLIKAGNACSSIADAVGDHEASVSDISEVRDDILCDLLAFIQSLGDAIEPPPKFDLQKNESYGWEAGLAAAIRDMDTGGEDDHVDTPPVKNEPIKKSKFTKLLPDVKSTSKDYVIKRFPVVIINSNISVGDIKGAGINVSVLGGYRILKDQIIMCINMTSLAKRDKRRDHKKYAKELLSVMGRKKNTKYIMAGSGIRYTRRKTGFLYYWVMEESKFDSICKSGRKTIGTSWGFAF